MGLSAGAAGKMQIDADLRAAGAALARGEVQAAHSLLQPLLLTAPGHPGLRQILGVVETKLGRLRLAEMHLREAVRLSPQDPRLRNSLANTLDAAGQIDAAIQEYETAIALDPAYLDARSNLGLAFRSAGRPAKAAEAFSTCIELAPQSANGWLYLGLVRLDLSEPAQAAPLLDEALRLDPNNLAALEARARAEADQGGDALPFYHRARRIAPNLAELALGEATALHRMGRGGEAVRCLRPMVEAQPHWRAGLAALAQLRWQWGDTDFLAAYTMALESSDEDPAILHDYLVSLSRAGRYSDVLAECDRRRVPPAFAMIEAAAASEVGDVARADGAFARAELSGQTSSIARVRHFLRHGRIADAALMAEALAASGDASAWSYLATAWRLNGDPRAEGLEDPAFITVVDLNGIELGALADRLRALHLGARAPFDQTIRGGAQTDGDLFNRREPEIRDLRRAIEGAVADYIERLPPPVAAHPMLGAKRNGFRFSGSWSVKLDVGGFHTSHTHPRGWISSACYVVVPPAVTMPGEAGRLVLGEPPAELGLSVAPLRTVEPAPGRLVLFPSYFWHRTTLFPAGERISVAFDVVPDTADP